MAVLAAPVIDWGGDYPQAEGALVQVASVAPVIVPIVPGVIPAPSLEIFGGGTEEGSVSYAS